MALKREAKQAIVVAVEEVLKTACAAVTAEYRSLTVAEMTNLRVKAREVGVYLRVIRNTLAKLALGEGEFSCLQPVLKGPLLFAFSLKEPGAAARLLRDFAKEHDALVVKHLAFEGQLLEAKSLNSIADLPTRVEAIARLMAVLQAPMQQLCRVLKAPQTQLVRGLIALKELKESKARASC